MVRDCVVVSRSSLLAPCCFLQPPLTFDLFLSYMRHYLNFWILYSVWFDFKLIPCAPSCSPLASSLLADHTSAFSSWNQAWRPSKGIWMAPFMRYQIVRPSCPIIRCSCSSPLPSQFGALSVIQALNLYWYFLIWRVLIRCVFSPSLCPHLAAAAESLVHQRHSGSQPCG